MFYITLNVKIFSRRVSSFTQERSSANFKATRRSEPVRYLRAIDSKSAKYSHIAIETPTRLDSSVDPYPQKSRANCARYTTSRNRVNREDDAFAATCHNRLDPTRFADKVNETECRRFVQPCKVRASPTFRHFIATTLLSYVHLSPTIPTITSFSNVLLTYRTGIVFPRERSLTFLAGKLSSFSLLSRNLNSFLISFIYAVPQALNNRPIN